MTDANRPEPHRRLVQDWMLILAAATAPIFWLGQMMLGYGVSSVACYPGDHPQAIVDGATLRGTLIVFDIVAVLVALGACVFSYLSWQRTKLSDGVGAGPARFLAQWASLSSLIFLCAIVFTVITSLGTPICS
jgi:hypothetical protein